MISDGKSRHKKNAPAPLERFGKNLGMFGNVWEKIGKIWEKLSYSYSPFSLKSNSLTTALHP